MPDGKPRQVWVAEAFYCLDTMYEDRFKEKELQHKHLQEALSGYGYQVIAVPIILGFYGTIFTTTVQSAQMLGVERARLSRSMNNLHAHASQAFTLLLSVKESLSVVLSIDGGHISNAGLTRHRDQTPKRYTAKTPSLRGPGRVWSIQGLPSAMPHGMVESLTA